MAILINKGNLQLSNWFLTIYYLGVLIEIKDSYRYENIAEYILMIHDHGIISDTFVRN